MDGARFGALRFPIPLVALLASAAMKNKISGGIIHGSIAFAAPGFAGRRCPGWGQYFWRRFRTIRLA
jgi:hypothetical protein